MSKRQRQRTERTRLALLAAARTLFAERGYAATTVAEITRAADRAHGTFYLYFDNKHDLFTALLAGMVETITGHAREVWADEPTLDAIWLGVRDFLHVCEEHRDLWDLLEQMAAVDEAAAGLRAGLRSTFAERIQRGIELTPTRDADELDPAIVAELLTAMVFRFARTGALPSTPDILALHVAAVWARAIGLPQRDVTALHERVLVT